jgi:hypothetical protein
LRCFPGNAAYGVCQSTAKGSGSPCAYMFNGSGACTKEKFWEFYGSKCLLGLPNPASCSHAVGGCLACRSLLAVQSVCTGTGSLYSSTHYVYSSTDNPHVPGTATLTFQHWLPVVWLWVASALLPQWLTITAEPVVNVEPCTVCTP